MDKKIIICVPTRGARESLKKLISTWRETTSGLSTLLLGIDEDQLYMYEEIQKELPPGSYVKLFDKVLPHCPKLELLSQQGMNLGYSIICSIGDDFVFHTKGWEEEVIAWQEREKGICYGNDLLQGAALATCAFIHSEVIKATGYICPPGLKSYRCDNYWTDLGIITHRIRYFPDIIIEHAHWSAKYMDGTQKAQVDETYRLGGTYEHSDAAIYDKFVKEGGLQRDAKLVLAIPR